MKRILFVEDDLSLIHGLSYALKKQGYELYRTDLPGSQNTMEQNKL